MDLNANMDGGPRYTGTLKFYSDLLYYSFARS